jgi:hypothetical protein
MFAAQAPPAFLFAAEPFAHVSARLVQLHSRTPCASLRASAARVRSASQVPRQ